MTRPYQQPSPILTPSVNSSDYRLVNPAMPKKHKLSSNSSPKSTMSSSSTASPYPVPTTFTDGLPLPKLLVFDLDYTLWPFWVDTHVTPPLRLPSAPKRSQANEAHQRRTSIVLDRTGEEFRFYNDVPGILLACKERGIKVAAASRTQTPQLARDMLGMLTVPSAPTPTPSIDYFTGGLEIYPGSKVTHFRRLKEGTGIEYEDMMFLDDERRNLDVQRELGVPMILVLDGVNTRVVDGGVREWRKLRGKEKAKKEEASVEEDSDV